MKLLTLIASALLMLAEISAAAEPNAEKVEYTVAFEVLPRDFLMEDAKDGSVILSDIEAFFLYQRGKVEPTENWPPKERTIGIHQPATVRYATDAKGKYTLKITFGRECEGLIPVTIESPAGSAFTLKQTVQLDLQPGAVLYLPCTSPVSKTKRGDDMLVFLQLRLKSDDED